MLIVNRNLPSSVFADIAIQNLGLNRSVTIAARKEVTGAPISPEATNKHREPPYLTRHGKGTKRPYHTLEVGIINPTFEGLALSIYLVSSSSWGFL
jgi:hypothetical protein